MPDRSSTIVHTEIMDLRADAAQVREFILTPERILDYFPGGIEGSVLDPGRAILCRNEMATSILEVVESESTPECLVLKVTTAIGLEAPFDRERVERHTMFTMIEDWALEETASGTRLTKSWRDVTINGDAPFDIKASVVEGAKHETEALITAWNRAAEASR